MREIIIERTAIEKMKNLTIDYKNSENGGFIIGRLNPTKVYIADVTDAGVLAKRSYYGVILDNTTLLKEINEYIEKDLFVIGTWHSHPKGYSLMPSSIDLETMKKLNSYYDTNYYPVFSIVNIDRFNKFKMCYYEVNEIGNLIELNYKVVGMG